MIKPDVASKGYAPIEDFERGIEAIWSVDLSATPQGFTYWEQVRENMRAMMKEIERQLSASPEAALKALENCECEKAKAILKRMVNK